MKTTFIRPISDEHQAKALDAKSRCRFAEDRMTRRFLTQLTVAAGLLAVAPPASADDQQLVQFFADTYAQWAIAEGKAVGVGVGVGFADKNKVFYTKAFGLADAARQTPFRADDTLFEIASNTKIFTTNLLGQAVFGGELKLDDELSKFASSLGSLKPLTGKVTLEELGDFTAGFADEAPLCKKGKKNDPPGCRPSERPTVSQYGAAAFLDYFRNATVSSLPAPYNYSNFSIGLLGLLIPSAKAKAPITDASLLGWMARVSDQILTPLGMTRTYLEAPGSITPASGYSLALGARQKRPDIGDRRPHPRRVLFDRAGGDDNRGRRLRGEGGRKAQRPRRRRED
jgi:CubicO group peptidase (beta-lactamase class C family)